VTCAICWGRSLIGLLVVMSVVVVLVLLFISFPVNGVGVGLKWSVNAYRKGSEHVSNYSDTLSVEVVSNCLQERVRACVKL